MVTQFMAKYYNNVYATEVSSTMQWRLKQKGYRLVLLVSIYRQEINCIYL